MLWLFIHIAIITGLSLGPLRVMDLSATRRGPAEAEEGATFVLTDEEKQDPVVAERLLARKLLRVLPGGELIGAIMDSVRELAGESGKPPRRILVYVRSPDTAQEIAKRIEKELGTKHVATLTGTIRGHERDQMASPSVKPEEIGDDAARRRAVVFKGFLAKPGREPPPETHFLVSTSAGEVGGVRGARPPGGGRAPRGWGGGRGGARGSVG